MAGGALDYIDWEVRGVTVLNLTGRITLGPGTKLLRSVIEDMLAQGKKDLLLNLAEVVYIDSTGLGELVSSFTRVKRANGRLKLLNLPSRAQELLALTRLHTVFEVFDHENEAVESFHPKVAENLPDPALPI